MPMPERCERFAEYRDKVLELFASKGFGQVGMRELATCLGLAPGSLYHHYPRKQHLLLDLIGLDTVLAILEAFYEGFNDSKYRPAPLLKEMVAAGYLGRKTGRGFHAYA